MPCPSGSGCRFPAIGFPWPAWPFHCRTRQPEQCPATRPEIQCLCRQHPISQVEGLVTPLRENLTPSNLAGRASEGCLIAQPGSVTLCIRGLGRRRVPERTASLADLERALPGPRQPGSKTTPHRMGLAARSGPARPGAAHPAVSRRPSARRITRSIRAASSRLWVAIRAESPVSRTTSINTPKT